METIIKRTYYTVEDLADLTEQLGWDEPVSSNDYIKVFLSDLQIILPGDMTAATSDTNSEKIFVDFMRRCWNEVVFFTDETLDWTGAVISAETETGKAISFLEKAASYFVRTLPSHKPILDAYAEKIVSLTAAVHSASSVTTKNNDMPVSQIDLENHLSNLDLVASSTDDDGGTTMARVAEIQSLYKNELEIWENDFVAKMVIEVLD